MKTYSHSGTVPVAGGLLTVLAAGIAAVVCGLIYGYAFYYIPLIYLNVLVTLAFAAGIGYSVAGGVAVGKVRNNLFVGTVSLAATLLGLYVYWGAYLWALAGIDQVGLWAFFPPTLIRFAQALFEKGSWGLSDGNPITGWVLAALWVVETGIVLVVSLLLSLRYSDVPFCETCNEWTQVERGVARLAADGSEPAWENVLAGDLPALAEFHPSPPGAAQFVRLDVARCPRCDQSRFVTIKAVEIVVDKNGNTSEKERELITNGTLTPGQFAVIEACSSLYRDLLEQADNEATSANTEMEMQEDTPLKGDA
jgi:hypothetical protein